MSEPRIIVALDFPAATPALEIVARLDPARCRLKVGKELFTGAGPVLVEQLVARGYGVFLDLKFHDIPNTVAGACAAAAELGCWMVNVHASGGRAMLEAARERLDRRSSRPLLIAVTVLTSLDDTALAEIGFAADSGSLVDRLSALALDCGLDGVVSSPLEIARLRRRFGRRPCLVIPGIRPADATHDDQKRVATPPAAIAAGADYLVIGRPITQAPEPLAALAAIETSLATGASARG